jgi:hypothetical protein
MTFSNPPSDTQKEFKKILGGLIKQEKWVESSSLRKATICVFENSQYAEGDTGHIINWEEVVWTCTYTGKKMSTWKATTSTWVILWWILCFAEVPEYDGKEKAMNEAIAALAFFLV